MLACARIGAMHSVIFGGFSADAVADRNNDAKAKLVITADGGWRRGKVVPLKANVDAALEKSPTVEKCIVFNRCNTAVEMKAGRDLWWHDLMADASADCPAEPLDSEHPLFILYTSGTTGKPKGVLHTTGGYLLGASLTHKWVFDLKEDDIYWCTADVGWVTGHSYIVYGPLAQRRDRRSCTKGPRTSRSEDRFWEIIEKYSVTIFYTAPTAIRAFIKWGDQWPEGPRPVERCGCSAPSASRSTRKRGCGITRSSAAAAARSSIRGGRPKPGAIMISPLPGAIADQARQRDASRCPASPPRSSTRQGNPVPRERGRLPGHQAAVAEHDADHLRRRRALQGDVLEPATPACYFTADGARQDEDGYIWVMGRVDDVLNVTGHRLSTMEVESALVHHPKVAEAAVVGQPDDIKGEGIVCFVTLKQGMTPTDELKAELKAHVAKEIGALARPDEIRFTDTLPKTRSGKIMRRLLRDIAAGRQSTGDTTTLEDLNVLAKLREDDE